MMYTLFRELAKLPSSSSLSDIILQWQNNSMIFIETLRRYFLNTRIFFQNPVQWKVLQKVNF